MKSFLLCLFCAASCVFAQAPASLPALPPDPGLLPRIYDLAGAIGNDGFKVRDGAWSGVLEGNQQRFLAVNLFAGNRYWFCAATSSPGETPAISLRGPSGQEIALVPFAKNGVAAAGVTAPVTGRYVLGLGGPARGSRDFRLLYLFK
ncbi:MAG: hypothetical protein ACO3YO_04720 [Chthoniobacterales bacterium]|jgi:hypothetical protein